MATALSVLQQARQVDLHALFSKQLEDLVLHLTQGSGLNDNVGITFFNGVIVDTNLRSSAATLHAVYAKKRNTDTDSFLKIYDEDAAAPSASSLRLLFSGLDEGDIQSWISEAGHKYTDGISIDANTTANGGTASAAADTWDGFIIYTY